MGRTTFYERGTDVGSLTLDNGELTGPEKLASLARSVKVLGHAGKMILTPADGEPYLIAMEHAFRNPYMRAVYSDD